MTKRHQAKYKIDRRMGQNIWGRPKSPINKREYGPGQHGQRRKGKLSDYGVQLRAKQKLKGYYANLSERQFHGIYDEARRLKGDTGANMIGLLERRLDTVIYRAKFVPTVFASRQFISHGHIKVNGKRVTVASFRVKVGDEVEVKEKSRQLALVLEANAARPSATCRITSKPITPKCRRSCRGCRRRPTCPTRCRWSRISWSNTTRANGISPHMATAKDFRRVAMPRRHDGSATLRPHGVQGEAYLRDAGRGRQNRQFHACARRAGA